MPLAYTERYTESVAELDGLFPASYNSVQNGSWIDMANYERMVARLKVGVISGGGTLDFKLQQATSSTGGNAKDISGKAITQLTQAGGDGNQICYIELRGEELDQNTFPATPFRWVRFVMTPASAASIAEVSLLGSVPNYVPVSTTNITEIID